METKSEKLSSSEVCKRKNSKMEVEKASLESVVNSILECLNDKDELVRQTLQQSLIKIVEKHPDESVNLIVDFRVKHPKLSEQTVAVLLRIIENSTAIEVNIKEETIKKVVNIATAEMTKPSDHVPNIQNPAKEILVAFGRKHCELVIQELMNSFKDGDVPHFMIMHCLGTLAIANTTGSYPFIKDILKMLLPNLGGVKLDIQKEALSYSIGKFSEALLEYTTVKFEREKCFDGPESPSEFDRCSAELSIAYDVLFNQWLHTREQKLSTEILESLSSIYPLLPIDKIHDQSQRLIPNILSFYRRSLDRIAVTQFLASVLKTNINLHRNTLDAVIDTLITQLFDLTCVYPDYEKPQTVKGHYEVLRCFDLLASTYSSKILDFLLIQLKGNGEREKIKSLLVLTHLTNSSSQNIASRLPPFIETLKLLIHSEKAIKMRMALLKSVVAFSQKSFIKDRDFVWFLVRFSCKYSKHNAEHGTPEEHNEFVQSCQNSLFMLSSTAGTMDELLKRELLNFFLMMDYSDISELIAKCLASLFAKNAGIEYDVPDDDDTNKIVVPSCEAVFARCLALMGNFKNLQKISNILTFLQFYYPHLNPELSVLWTKLIADLNLTNNKEEQFFEALYLFVSETVAFLNRNDENFAERLINKMADQLHLYPVNIPNCEFFIPALHKERGMLAECMGMTLCFIIDPQTIDIKVETLINTGKNEKLDKYRTYKEFEEGIDPFAKALGFISKVHSIPVLKKLKALTELGSKKQSTGFFSNLNFIKDSNKETDTYKTNLLIFISYGYILQFSREEGAAIEIIEESILQFMINQLNESKDLTMKHAILHTFLKATEVVLKARETEKAVELKLRNDIIQAIFNIPIEQPFENLPLLPHILKLGTDLIKVEHDDSYDGGVLFEIACKNFFLVAQQLKTKFDSLEEDEKNSFLAQYLNQSLPELYSLVKIIIELDPSPANLDIIISILESWTKDRNSEARICASHVFNNALEVYIKSMKIGCEAPSKFNQTGLMLGKIVPRCIDTNATVRQISVEILQKTLEISCIYDTLTIAGSDDDWVKQLEHIKEFIITDDPKEIDRLAGEISRIIALRMSNFQYLQFCKTLLGGLQDHEISSAIGSAVVLKFFIEEKGSELFHCIPELVNESFMAIKNLDPSRARAKSGVLKSIVALTKHHPKLVCNEMLSQSLPFEEHVIKYWNTVCLNEDLSTQIIENFLGILMASCLYEPSNESAGDRQKIASVQPFAIFCAMKEIYPSKEIKNVLTRKFPELFAMLLTSLATYTNLAPPMLTAKSISPTSNKTVQSTKSKFGFIPNKESIKMNPCQIVLDTFLAFLINLEMEQLFNVLTVCPQLAKSVDLKHFIELLSPMANGIEKQFTMGSSTMKDICSCLSKFVASPYEGQRVASIGLFSQLVPLKPFGEISSCIMFHLNSGLSDPSPLVRGLCIMGMAYIGSLTEADSLKYSEIAITALLKGIEDSNQNCLVNIPLESMRGLSRILQTLPANRVESFHVSLAIRIRPFFGNSSSEIREAAITLFGDLCESKMTKHNELGKSLISNNEALKEQLFHNFSALVLHLSESDPSIVRACKNTLRKVTKLMQAPKVKEMAQKHLIDHGNLNYCVFLFDFMKLAGEELVDHVQDFIDSCIPHLKSPWPEIRGNAAIIIGILNNFLPQRNHNTDNIGQKISILLKDENSNVRMKAALALGYFFGDI